MKKYLLQTKYKKLLADTLTPVSIYLKLRDHFHSSLLLESSDYHGNENSYSYVCCKAIASISMQQNTIVKKFPDGSTKTESAKEKDIAREISEFAASFKADESEKFNFINNGLFGYIAYDTVRYFEDIEITERERVIPDFIYNLYQYIIVINHFKNELYIFAHQYDKDSTSLTTIESLLLNRNFATYDFEATGEETSNFEDSEFLDVLTKGHQHCKRGDVFQVVLSRRFSRSFRGDEFNVYRTLRSINPSPYLFYYDYGSFKIFGSSPEAQILIKQNNASIFPIAGTFKRTGDDTADTALAEKLKDDPKENSEHVMLVDLARNDLSRNGENVTVDIFKEVQFYSHVLHLVSKVSCHIKDIPTMKVVADTFPAGTLSGAPKHRAMQLIDQYEKSNRCFYGGCIGFMGFNGDFIHAIIIRSFLSQDNALCYQAGAGVVAKSDIPSEFAEVNNKLLALRKAIAMAEEI